MRNEYGHIHYHCLLCLFLHKILWTVSIFDSGTISVHSPILCDDLVSPSFKYTVTDKLRTVLSLQLTSNNSFECDCMLTMFTVSSNIIALTRSL